MPEGESRLRRGLARGGRTAPVPNKKYGNDGGSDEQWQQFETDSLGTGKLPCRTMMIVISGFAVKISFPATPIRNLEEIVDLFIFPAWYSTDTWS